MKVTFIKRIKLLYRIYNFFQKDKLIHNEYYFKKISLKKRYYSSISSVDFKDIDPNILKQETQLTPINETALFKKLEVTVQEHVARFDELGYAILPKFISDSKADAINTEIDDLLKTRQVRFNEVNKIMFAIGKSQQLRDIAKDSDLIEFLSSICGFELKLFQSINFIQGSQQATHSDSVHMTTFPLGGLLGLWIALEDIEVETGALHYYPGSHKLPYYLNPDYKNEGSKWLLGDKEYNVYEKMLQHKILENKLQKEIFKARKGDALIWHANLFHGGEPHTDKTRTRKSVVFHYFNPHGICYHEVTQRPALIQAY
jgi:ectoine hydroxylase-related dioxygenase (phytanoyl-CoA dioxygenase family)